MVNYSKVAGDHLNYDRTIRMYDEGYPPEVLDKIVVSGEIHKGKFVHSNFSDSYMLQMKTLKGLKGAKKILEIGPGEMFTARNLKTLGYTYHTLDQDPRIEPTYVCSFFSFEYKWHKNEYDAVCAFQVLEHLPYGRFKEAICRMKTISRKYIVISLPYSCKGFRESRTEWDGQFNKTAERVIEHFEPTNLPNRRYRKEYIEEFPWAVHYWEIGRKGFPLVRVIDDIEACELKILDRFHSEEPFHYFIVIEIM